MRYGGVLSKIARREKFASCKKCEVVYQDDAPQGGIVDCPYCECAVVRGLTRKEAKDLLDDNQKEILS